MLEVTSGATIALSWGLGDREASVVGHTFLEWSFCCTDLG